jgi:hypothetical protein
VSTKTIIKGRRGTIAVKRELIDIGGKRMAPRGFTLNAALELLAEDNWIRVDEFARIMTGKSSKTTRQKARAQLRMVRKHLKVKGIYVVVMFAAKGSGHHGELVAVRRFKPDGNITQREALEQFYSKLEDEKDITEAAIEEIKLLIRRDREKNKFHSFKEMPDKPNNEGGKK